MIKNAKVHVTLPAVDLKRAEKFYQEKLGLKVLKEDPSPGAIMGLEGGDYIYLYQRAATKADHTAASFTVDDVEETVKELRGKGVVFEEYDMPGLNTVNGIATMDGMKVAWFKDTEGNILAVGNMRV